MSAIIISAQQQEHPNKKTLGYHFLQSGADCPKGSHLGRLPKCTVYTQYFMPTCQQRLSRQRKWAVASRTSAICKKQRIIPRAHPALQAATAHRVRIAIDSHVAKRQDIRSVVALPSTARQAGFAAPFAECGSNIEPGLKVPKKTKKRLREHEPVR